MSQSIQLKMTMNTSEQRNVNHGLCLISPLQGVFISGIAPTGMSR